MSIKRSPEIERGARGTYAAMSKAAWAEAYRDLYIQVFGAEMALPTLWAQDANRRADILAGYRRAESLQDEAKEDNGNG